MPFQSFSLASSFCIEVSGCGGWRVEPHLLIDTNLLYKNVESHPPKAVTEHNIPALNTRSNSGPNHIVGFVLVLLILLLRQPQILKGLGELSRILIPHQISVHGDYCCTH